jgi:hypothetical protein
MRRLLVSGSGDRRADRETYGFAVSGMAVS